MQARESGKCIICKGTYQVGDSISWVRNGMHRGRRYHVACREVMTNDEFLSFLTTVEPLDPDYDGTHVSHAPQALEPKGSVNNLSALSLDELDDDDTDNSEATETVSVDSAVLAKLLDRVSKLESYLVASSESDDDNAYGERPEYPHAQFDTVAYYLKQGEHVYLYGAPGSGKSTLAYQLSVYLGRSYGYVSLNPQTSEFRLLGYKDASGRYHPTDFREIYEHGGIFCIDEMDNANPSLLTTLNGLLENDLAAFPDGMVRRHKDFVLVATGNTTGRGASRQFPDRRKFDAAFSERFVFAEIAYDESMERKIALSINSKASKAVDWVQSVRRWALNAAPEMVVSPRASYKLAKHMGNSPQSGIELAHAVLFKGISVDTVKLALTANPINGAF